MKCPICEQLLQRAGRKMRCRSCDLLFTAPKKTHRHRKTIIRHHFEGYK